jgi:hypothetical protein
MNPSSLPSPNSLPPNSVTMHDNGHELHQLRQQFDELKEHNRRSIEEGNETNCYV